MPIVYLSMEMLVSTMLYVMEEVKTGKVALIFIATSTFASVGGEATTRSTSQERWTLPLSSVPWENTKVGRNHSIWRRSHYTFRHGHQRGQVGLLSPRRPAEMGGQPLKVW